MIKNHQFATAPLFWIIYCILFAFLNIKTFGKINEIGGKL